MRRVLILLACLWPALAHGQTVSADRVRLNTAPCVVDSVDGTPDQLRLTGNCSAITTSAATNLTLMPTGDLVLGPAGTDILPDIGYTQNLGMLTKKYLTLHAAELWVETLVAQNTIATIGGRVLVAPTNILTADLASGGTSISVKYNNFANGDRVYMEANGAVEFMAVTSGASGSGPYTYSVTRNLDGSGANDWAAGDALLDTGTTGNGFIDLYSTAGILSSGSGPTIVGNVRTGTAYNAYAPRWAIGNLNGLYGYGATTYGAVFGDPSATNLTVDATNGIRIRSGTTNKLAANTSGDLSLTGDLSIGTSGDLRIGATAYGTGTGLWADYNGGTPRFRVGNPAGNQLTWDGTTLTVAGVGSGLTSIDGGNIQTNTINVGSINATGFGDNVIKNCCFEGTTVTAQHSTWQDRSSAGYVPSDIGCCGTKGPLFMYMHGGSGNVVGIISRAWPVSPGDVYNVTLDILASTTTTANIWVLMRESSSNNGDVTYVDGTGTGAVPGTSFTFLYTAGGSALVWTPHQFTYTVPAGVFWVSLELADVTGPPSSTYSDVWFDNVFVRKQLGTGDIRANTITANEIAAGTITATQIAAGTITATEISVSSLDAISANMGTLTAGSIDLSGGGGGVFINSTDVYADFIGSNGDIASFGTAFLNGLVVGGLGGSGAGYVCTDNSGNLYRGASCP